MEKPKKNSCAACGMSPVNHSFMFMQGMIGEVIEFLGKFSFGSFSFMGGGRSSDVASRILFSVLSLSGFIRFSSDRKKALSDRTRLIWDEADARRIPMEQVAVFGKLVEHYRAKVFGKWHYFEILPIPYWFSQSDYEWVDNKLTFKKFLAKRGFPTPSGRSVRTIASAYRAFNK